MVRKRLIPAFLTDIRFLLLPIPLCFLVGCHTLPRDKHPIDKTLSECMDNSKCIKSKMKDCLVSASDKWESEIDKYYSLLMEILPDESKEALKKSQDAWVKFRNLEFETIPDIYRGIIGSFQGPTFLGHKITILKARALELQAYYEQTKDEERILK